MGRTYDRISIVSVQDIVENGQRLEIPMSVDVLKKAASKKQDELSFRISVTMEVR